MRSASYCERSPATDPIPPIATDRSRLRFGIDLALANPADTVATRADGWSRVHDYFASRGWTPFDFQQRTWRAYLDGRSGLVHAPTGSGKTWSVFGGPAMEAIDRGEVVGCGLGVVSRGSSKSKSSPAPRARIGRGVPKVVPTPDPRLPTYLPTLRGTTAPLTVLWLTPMRALANDTAHNLATFSAALGLNWSVELRTSDTAQSVRKRQRDRLPSVLVTTPESLSVLLSFDDARVKLAGIRAVIMDEWHELLSTKRGTQAELGIARLRQWSPGVRTWGLSATLGNLQEAADVLVPSCHLSPSPGTPGEGRGEGSDRSRAFMHKREYPHPNPLPAYRERGLNAPLLIHSDIEKKVELRTLFPEKMERFPWAGHIGAHMADAVAKQIQAGASTLVFTNTRAQAEIWFRQLMQVAPELVGDLAIHHGSLDRTLRAVVENMLREGRIRAVVCTSSLDLGVDFSAVDQVIQVGSPKGIARLMQRAGRSGHQPGQPSKLYCVPTHAFELIEFSASREGIEQKTVESRRPLIKPLDVLVQHVVTVSAGGGFDSDELFDEVKTTFAFADLTLQEWGWVMDFVTRGGPTLTAYDRFKKVIRHETSGLWTIASEALARLHRLSIGTITGNGTITLVHGHKKLGTLEEGFVSKLKPGDVFTFAGQALELLSLRQMVAKVRPNKNKRAAIVSWPGSKFPLSTMLAHKVRARLEQARNGIFVDAEMEAIRPVLEIQERWSHLPTLEELLVERTLSREGVHYYLYPFLGRLVHEGLAAVIGHRIGRETGLPVTATFTDYGIELLMPREDFGEKRTDARSGIIRIQSAGVQVDRMSDAMFERRAGEEMTLDVWRKILTPDQLLEDLLACLNAGELTRRQFREISRVAGLLIPTTPGSPRTTRQLQASSELFYDVFVEFDPHNLLLEQAKREVLEQQLEVQRLTSALEHLRDQTIVLKETERFSPMAFPLWAQRISSQSLRTEAAGERIERMLEQLEAAAD